MLFLYDMVRTPGDESWNMYNRRDMGVAYEALFGKQCVSDVELASRPVYVFSLSGSNNLEDVQKEVNDVQVEIQCGKGVVINGELHFMSTPWSKHHLGVEDNVEGKEPL